MSYLGDYAEDFADLNFKFNTRQFSTGAPFALAGSPVVSVYKSNDATQTTAGVTLTNPFDGVVGLMHVKIDLSADAFYATGEDYQVVLTAGTVDGISVAGAVLAEFSIENRFMRGTDGVDTATMRGTDGVDTATMRGTDSASLASVCTETRLAELDAGNLPADVAAIPTTAMRGTDGVDTATMRGTDGVDTATMRGTDDAALATTVGVAGAGLTDLGGMSTGMKAEVEAEVNDALDTAIPELTGVPSATPTIRVGIMLGYMMARNKVDVQTSGTDSMEVHNSAGTKIVEKLITDDGTDYSEAKLT